MVEWRLTVTERNWLVSVGIVAGSVLVFHLIALVEGYWAPAARLVRHPMETSMRCIALPHFIIAMLFTLSSQKMRSNRNKLRYVGLFLIGAGLCFGHASLGGPSAAVPSALFLVYFLAHEFRDEAFFYVANGDAPPDTDTKWLQKRILIGPAFGLTFFAAGALGAGVLGMGRLKEYFGPLATLPVAARLMVAALPVAVPTLLAVFLVRRARRAGRGTLLRRFPPLSRVAIGILAIVLLDSAIYQRTYAIVSLHVCAWFVFILYQFNNRPAPDPVPPRFTWTWMRTTKAGFVFLHVGLILLVTAGAAVWAYQFGNGRTPSVFWIALSREAFPYWTIIHITTSFLPR